MRSLLKYCLAWIARRLYRIRTSGTENLKLPEGGAVLVVNHVSFIDGILLCSVLPGRPLFAVDRDVGRVSWVKPVISLADYILIDCAHPFGLRRLLSATRSGRQTVVFPESRITVTGSIMKCYAGAALIAARAGVPVIPVNISGAELSRFSYLGSIVRQRMLPAVRISFGQPLTAPAIADRQAQRLFLHDVLGAASREKLASMAIAEAIETAATRVGAGKPAITDNDRKPVTYKALCQTLVVPGEADDRNEIDDRTIEGAVRTLKRMIRDDSPQVMRAVAGLGAAWDIHPGDRVFNATSGGSALGLTAGLLLPLVRGATVFRYRFRRDTRDLGELIYDFNATVLILDRDAVNSLQKADTYDFHRVRIILTTLNGASDERLAGFRRPFYRAIISAENGLPVAAESPFWRHGDAGMRILPGVDGASGISVDQLGFVPQEHVA